MNYDSPTDIETALDILSQSGPSVVAGGTDFYPARGPRPIEASILDITAVPDLSGIGQDTQGIRIGATTTWSEVIAADLPPAFNALKEAAQEVGSHQIQNAGTVAGNLCNASPAADGVPALLILDAQVELRSRARGVRQLPLAAFITGPRQTSADPDELLTAILVPHPTPGAKSCFEKLGARRYLVISTTMCAALVRCDENRCILDLKLAIGACSPVAKRLTAFEVSCMGQPLDTLQISRDDLAPLSPIDDVRADAGFRLDAVATQCLRAIQRAAQ